MSVAIVGVGQLGSVFAHGLLRAGHTVVPIRRGEEPAGVERPGIERVELTLVCVGEGDLPSVLNTLPVDRPTGLVQNGLLPRDWAGREPTVAVVWFEKKKTTTTNVIQSTPISGPQAGLLIDALATIDIPAHLVDANELADALVLKNLYIVSFNVLGLELPATVGELFEHETLRAIGEDVLDVQQALLGQQVDRDRLWKGLRAAVEGDPAHGARGRSAPARLKRVIAQADAHDLETPALRALAARVS